MDPRIAVVIPFFQRESGPLRRACESILAQSYPGDFLILIADDQSPVSVTSEIDHLALPPRCALRVLHQENQGPGAARNLALSNIPQGFRYVAFLDSDDCWRSDHITNAVYALEAGFDFYFSDFMFSDYTENSAFLRAGKIRASDHRPLEVGSQAFAYQYDMHDQIFIKGNVIGTSNVVYRFERYPMLRFREEFFNGQDYLFWLDLSRETDQICFSTNVECDCGRGVNIYAGAGWNTERSLQRLANETKLWSSVSRIFDLTPEQESANRRRLSGIRQSIVRDILHRLAHRMPLDKSALVTICRHDPRFTLLATPLSMKILAEKIFGR